MINQTNQMTRTSEMSLKRMPASAVVYVVLAGILGLTALYCGYALWSEPQGTKLQLPMQWLATSPFQDYFIPGLILFFVLGAGPFVVIYGLVRRPDWHGLDRLSAIVHEQWPWLAAAALGLATMIWIVVQILMLRVFHPMQVVIGLWGVALLALPLTRSMRQAYAL